MKDNVIKNEATIESAVVTESKIKTIVANVTDVTVELKDMLVYDEDVDRWVRKTDEEGKVIKRKLITLHFDTKFNRILDAAHNFEAVETDKLTFSRYSLQRALTNCDTKASKQYVKLYDKTEMTEFSLSAIMEAYTGATVCIVQMTRDKGDEYITADGEVKQVEHKHYQYDILDVEIDDDAYNSFVDEVREQIADYKAEQLAKKQLELAEAKAQAAAIAQTVANATTTDAPF